uniref:tRNA-dihydrouridine(47) synthase [NAD(P)(+)] n=1 Tax=Culicoides sonorensis TaxID=179676 RepID=A0A336L797_CULSO
MTARLDDTVCYIKKEFVIERPTENLESIDQPDKSEATEVSEPPQKKQKKEKRRGKNTNRPVFKEDIATKLCRSVYNGPNSGTCNFSGNCKMTHDVAKYLESKPEDISDTCYIYSTKGFCRFGVSCRFAKAHLDENLNNLGVAPNEPEMKIDEFPKRTVDLFNILRKRKFDFSKSDEILREVSKTMEENRKNDSQPCTEVKTSDVEVKPTSRERKLIDFRDKTYLAPLTTVGNLPFRRICKEFQVDITCGEMACAIPLINGQRSEWALTRKHESEDFFGIQICGHSYKILTYACQVLAEEADFDFIDLNCGCPIDLIYRQGAGSGLLNKVRVLESVVRSCSSILHTYGKAFTVKTRTGVYENKSIAHELMPKIAQWGASQLTLHGRSREQRYTKLANYEYIQQCADAVKDIPVFGNGDIMSFEDYNAARKLAPSISGLMIGRGALIKPWIFQEIKEQRHMDPSSSERFDMLKRYVNYGLEHWGSDVKGVETTRRFLLEWQSFLHRYVPYGILERPPQKINQRPCKFTGRDELETLMASNSCSDWIKLSEMLLGPVPDGFQFLPKHKANSY